MKAWATGLSVLSAAFVGTVVVTMSLAAVLVPQSVAPPSGADPSASGGPAAVVSPPPIDQVPDRIGGVLTVSGDADGSFVLDRENAEIGFVFDEELEVARLADGPYQLSGADARITFAVDPLAVDQVDLEGFSSYPEPDACEITPGALNPTLGIASAALRCPSIADIRDDGVIALEGTIWMAADVLGMRGDLPDSGGTIAVGSQTVELAEARALLQPFGFDAATGLASMVLLDEGMTEGVILSYDPHTHELDVQSVVVEETSAEAPAACSVARTDIGLLNPRTSVVELAISCDVVEMPGIGPVPVSGSLVVDLIGVDAPP